VHRATGHQAAPGEINKEIWVSGDGVVNVEAEPKWLAQPRV